MTQKGSVPKSTGGSNKGGGPFSHLAAGAVSGAVASLLVQPLDVIKTRQQQASSKVTSTVPLEVKYRSVFSTASTIAKEEGVLGLWKGTSPTLYRVIPGGGLYFFFIHYLSTTLSASRGDKPASAVETLLTGSAARMLVSATLHPVTVVKTRFEGVGSNYYSGTIDALRTIAGKEGIRGLFSGFLPTLLRDAPFSGIYYLLYDKTKTNLTKEYQLPHTVVSILAGAFAGVVATLVTHPQDVIKTRLQITPLDQLEVTKGRALTLIQSTFQKEGVRGFYKGLLPRLVRRPMVAAITWSIYEEIRTLSSK